MKKYLDFILRLLNLKIDKNQAIILSPLIIVGLLATYISPTLNKAIITALPAEWLAFQSLCCTLFGLLTGIVWQGRIRSLALRYFIALITSESIAGFVLGLYLAFIEWDVWVFAVSSLIYTNLISVFVSKCVMFIKSRLWVEKEREIYDNNNSILIGLTCVIGFGCALLFLPSLELSLVLWSITCLIDNIGWGIVYWKNRFRFFDDNKNLI